MLQLTAPEPTPVAPSGALDNVLPERTSFYRPQSDVTIVEKVEDRPAPPADTSGVDEIGGGFLRIAN